LVEQKRFMWGVFFNFVSIKSLKLLLWLGLVKRGWFKPFVFGLVLLKEKVSRGIPKQQYPTLSYHLLPNATSSEGELVKCLPNTKKRF
jgi:hypothetical protein